MAGLGSDGSNWVEDRFVYPTPIPEKSGFKFRASSAKSGTVWSVRFGAILTQTT